MKKGLLALFLAAVLTLTSGCGTVLDWHLTDRIVAECGTQTLSDKEFRILALEYKCLYEVYYKELLSEDFWDIPMSEELSFEDYVKQDCLLKDCTALLNLGLAAEKEGITLTDEEEERVKRLSERYYGRLTPDEKKFIDSDPEDVEALLRRFLIAFSTIRVLLKEKVVEVSDEASRVLDLEVIHTENAADAEALKKRLDKGENFKTLAMENTIDDGLLYSVCRENLVEPFCSVIFSLSQGEVSDVIVFNGEGYIFRVDASYNMLLSQNNKSNMLAELRFADWMKVYQNYNISAKPKVNHAFLKKTALKLEGDFPYVPLFEGLVE